jgi:TRAP-type C4-dicarboxylate transport system permease small subunit
MNLGTFLNNFERFNRALNRRLSWIGIAGLLVLTGITCVDIVGSKLFLAPVPGSVDIVGLSQIIAIAFTGGITKIMGQHVRVEFFVDMMPRRAQRIVNSIISFLLLAFFLALVVRTFALGMSLQAGGHSSLTARIPLYPFAYALAIAFIPLCLLYLFDFIRSATEEVRK